MPVRFSPAAVQDLEEIGDYIHAENPLAAHRLIAGLRSRCEKLADAPRSGTFRPELWIGLRSIPFRRYVVFYTVQDDDVRIERILHGSRDIRDIFDEDGDHSEE